MIPYRIHEAILFTGVHSRDLAPSEFYDPTMEGTLQGLCLPCCEVANVLHPGRLRLARLRRAPHFFVVGLRGSAYLDFTEASFLPASYANRTLHAWPKLSRRGKTFLRRVERYLESH